MKRNLLVSFSGGRTSAYMSYLLKNYFYDKYNLFFVFANTGQEREETLEFVQQCDEYIGMNLTWVEAVVDPRRGKGTKHRIVDFKTADRTGAVFESVIEKYGISNRNFPNCTRELKERPIHSFSKQFGFKYETAIGIRGDEYRRVKNHKNIIYPLADIVPTDKQTVLDFWSIQPFDLRLEEHQGNCSWCWKKSFKKLFVLIDETPEIFDFPRRMEKKHAMAGPSGQPQVFFRTGLSTDQLFKAHGEDRNSIDLNIDDGCSESCEMYETDGTS